MNDEEETEDVDLHEGMAVANEDGEPLGTLAALLVAEDEEEAEFLLLRTDGIDRLIPFEAVLGVGDDALVLDVPKTIVAQFPRVSGSGEPTDAEMELAYKVYDENAQYETDEE